MDTNFFFKDNKTNVSHYLLSNSTLKNSYSSRLNSIIDYRRTDHCKHCSYRPKCRCALNYLNYNIIDRCQHSVSVRDYRVVLHVIRFFEFLKTYLL